ncbi:protein timeless homolog [Ruditapes philippinarum]|uniref:protein timeless homolog n=1 Tax=Ruditapes philippinarum TaxID=129788 RepID=UPI00295A9E53|nr:protein timeless homolog [Ruditapes philippinarum]XP_060554623.1 protein timeless homolog [Ruditapes philippinarum]
MVMHVELQASCSALGYQEGKSYVKEPDCIETVKDLIRFLKREDETCDIRRQLGHAQIVQNDLLPILIQYSNEETLWETVIRLLVNLTQPAILCFNGQIPEEKSMRNYFLEVESHLQLIKEAFINEEVFAVITGKLGDMLKLDWEHRHEEHRLLIERLLILIRNILHVPTNPDDEMRTDDDASVHDQVLWALHVSGLEDILLYIGSSEEERNLSMHILEIVSLMFREQDADTLAAAGVQKSESEKVKDERELQMVREQEKLQKKANQMKFSSRHSRFGGTFVVKNFKSISDNDLIYHKSHGDVSRINLDTNKKPKKKAKNRKPIIDRDVKRRSTLSIRLGLKEFCIQFLENCYNPLMYAVKDILNREKSQEHDETYYLWAMRFFMEFCRLHSGQVDLVSETMSVQAFHYIQVQLFQYYEMQQMEKKEAIVWGKRTHLALKAYQELLLTLDSMDRSGNSTLMESSKVIKSNIFYTMEFRDIFLTLLRHFDQSRQSRSYLKDLIETTHLFLKMLENFSKRTGHLVVQKKKKKVVGRKKKPRKTGQGHVEPSEQELEDLWDDISSELSAIFQGRSDIPDDIAPFDAASEIDVDQQRVDAMIQIQNCMREKKAGEAVAIFRAAREVWPDRNEFGSADIAPEDEFMALREIFMTNLPRPTSEIPGEPDYEQDEMEGEEEEMVTMETSEQEFIFRDFVVKFAKPEVLKAYVLLTADFQKNSTHTNHCCIKMLHRVAFDLGYIGMLFQISLFRVFQKIMLTPLAKAERYKEIYKFATHIVRRFVEVAENNNKIFMEILFWKTSKDAIELVEGYGSYQSKGKVLWSEDAEMEVRRLFEDYKENDEEGKDTVDCIMERITDPTKTRGQIIRELKRQELIESAKELKKAKSGTRAGPWREEDELELGELFDRYKDAPDPVGAIIPEMCKRRSRQKIIEKLLSMGLVSDRKELFKKRGKSGARSRGHWNRSDDESGDEGMRELPSDIDEGHSDNNSDVSSVSGSSSDSGDESRRGSDDDSDDNDSKNRSSDLADNMTAIITGLVEKGYKDQIAWIQRGLNRTADDREEEDEDVGVPIVPLTEENETAMEDKMFLSFLSKIGLAPPANEQEAFWRIPAELRVAELRNIATGLVLDENNHPVNADRIQIKKVERKKKQKKERKRKKEKVPKQKKNASKFAALKELVKKKSEAKKTKRIRKKPASDETGSLNDRVDSPVRENNTENQSRNSSSKKKRVKMVSSSDSDSDDDKSVTSQRSGVQSTVTGTQSDSEARTQSPERSMAGSQISHSSQKKRLKKIVSSDSESDNDEPLKNLATETQSNSDSDDDVPLKNLATETQSNSDSDDDVPLKNLATETQSNSDSDDDVPLKNLATGTQSDSDEDKENQSQDSKSQPLSFSSSSDESDQENGSTKGRDTPSSKSASQSSKRSRSSDSESEVSQGQAKKARIMDSDSDDDKPVPSATEGSFPATLYTQGQESDSDLDDHVPLRKVIQKRKIIESDDDE